MGTIKTYVGASSRILELLCLSIDRIALVRGCLEQWFYRFGNCGRFGFDGDHQNIRWGIIKDLGTALPFDRSDCIGEGLFGAVVL